MNPPLNYLGDGCSNCGHYSERKTDPDSDYYDRDYENQVRVCGTCGFPYHTQALPP